jgi:hypothetical protein
LRPSADFNVLVSGAMEPVDTAGDLVLDHVGTDVEMRLGLISLREHLADRLPRFERSPGFAEVWSEVDCSEFFGRLNIVLSVTWWKVDSSTALIARL